MFPKLFLSSRKVGTELLLTGFNAFFVQNRLAILIEFLSFFIFLVTFENRVTQLPAYSYTKAACVK